MNWLKKVFSKKGKQKIKPKLKPIITFYSGGEVMYRLPHISNERYFSVEHMQLKVLANKWVEFYKLK